MSYIGRSPQIGAYHKLDAITTDGSASYTMQLDSANFVPESVNHLIVSVNGVIQAPTDSFTVSGSTITFASSLSVSDTIDFIMALGNVLDIGVPSDATISTAKIQDSAVTNAKLQNSSITLNGSAVSLGGSATVGGSNTPAFDVTRTSNQSVLSNTWTKIQFNVEKFDTDNCFDSTTNYRFTPTESGKYYLNATVLTESVSDNVHQFEIRIYKNGVYHKLVNINGIGLSAYNDISQSISAIVEANGTSDYFEVYVKIKGDQGQTQGIEVDTARSLWFSGYKLVGA